MNCTFLGGPFNSLGINALNYYFTTREVKEDEDLWLYFNAVDIEGLDFFTPVIMDCIPGAGTIKVASKGSLQTNDFIIGSNGIPNITNEADLDLITSTLLTCTSFANGPTFDNFDQSSIVSNKGYYFHFTPNAGEFGVN